MRTLAISLFVTLSVPTTPSVAQTAPGPTASTPEPKLICRKISDNPSDKLAPRQKVCKTAEEWKAGQRAMKDMPQQQAKPTGY
jgi:hypothetical protein